jgi:uncharacterized membrane protein YdjX (TVP38/TMEM64 family)
MNAKIFVVLLLLLLLIAAFFIFDLQNYFSLDYLKSQMSSLAQWRADHPVLLAGAFFMVYVVFAALGLPVAAILTLASGAIFGFWQGLVLASFASTIGAVVAFLLTRYLFQESIQSKFGDKLQSINRGIKEEGAFYVFGLRLVPLFPFFVVNALLALTPLKVTTFYWVSQIGMLLGTGVFVYAGTQLAEIKSTSDILSPGLLIAFTLLGLFPLLAKQLLNWLRSRKQTIN